MINVMVEPCKEYSGGPEEGDLTDRGGGEDGFQQGEFRKPPLWVSGHLHVEGRTGNKNNPNYWPLCGASVLGVQMEHWSHIKMSRIS